MNAKRGFVPEDERNFSPEAMGLLKTASRHVAWLLDEGYDLKKASTFVGNHFLLSERQRMAIMRSVASGEQLALRREKQVAIEEISGKEVWIDGFNIIITLEVLLCGSFLFECMDGSIRDLAGLRGTYRLIPETERAVQRMLSVLREAGARRVNVLLDEPVSNSGRLKGLIAEVNDSYGLDLDIRILRNVDRELYGKALVITSDSVILDHCESWVNLTGEWVRREGADTIRIF